MIEVLAHLGDEAVELRVRAEVMDFTAEFPLYLRRWKAADGTPYRVASGSTKP